MRIISGKYKGRRISPPKGLPVRPTTDMSKEALFNVLNNHFSFEGLKILDLIAGTGNISYEFASRGCTPITSVDGDFGCVKFIKQIAAEYDFNIAATKSDVFKFLESSKTSYDIIFADPPYHNEQLSTAKKLLGLLKVGGCMILSNSGRGGILEETGIVVVDNRSYSNAYITLYRRDS